jgi:hypothetical protein
LGFVVGSLRVPISTSILPFLLIFIWQGCSLKEIGLHCPVSFLVRDELSCAHCAVWNLPEGCFQDSASNHFYPSSTAFKDLGITRQATRWWEDKIGSLMDHMASLLTAHLVMWEITFYLLRYKGVVYYEGEFL